MATLTSPAILADPNGNNDSGYAPSQPDIMVSESPKRSKHQVKRNGAALDTELRQVVQYFTVPLSCERALFEDDKFPTQQQ